MADENGFAALFCERLPGGVNVRGERRERIFDERYVVALLQEDIGNGPPAGLVDESAMHEHDIASRPFGRLSRLRGRGKYCSSQEDGSG
jgi:hypothetical protein